MPPISLTFSAEDRGRFFAIQAAVALVPYDNRERVTIKVKPGGRTAPRAIEIQMALLENLITALAALIAGEPLQHDRYRALAAENQPLRDGIDGRISAMLDRSPASS